MKISLFATCLVEMFASTVGKAAVELLERLGCEIDFQNHKPAEDKHHITVVM